MFIRHNFFMLFYIRQVNSQTNLGNYIDIPFI